MRVAAYIVCLTVALAGARADTEDPSVVAARLGDKDPLVRDRAERDLLRMGERAQGALEALRSTTDLEIATRVARVLDDLVWPAPGAAANGLALAIRADVSYPADKPVALRARLMNTSAGDLTIVGAQTSEPSEYMHLLLALDGPSELHMCYRATLPLPSLAPRFVVAAGDWVAFRFYPNTWCAQEEHSKCSTVELAPGPHRIRLALYLRPTAETAWSGRAESNEVRFALAK